MYCITFSAICKQCKYFVSKQLLESESMPEQKSEACATPLAAPPAEKPVLYAESSQEQTTVRI